MTYIASSSLIIIFFCRMLIDNQPRTFLWRCHCHSFLYMNGIWYNLHMFTTTRFRKMARDNGQPARCYIFISQPLKLLAPPPGGKNVNAIFAAPCDSFNRLYGTCLVHIFPPEIDRWNSSLRTGSSVSSYRPFFAQEFFCRIDAATLSSLSSAIFIW